MPLFSTKQLTIGIGQRPLIERLSLSVEPGEIVALTGPSGCGKTTLLRTLAGLIDPLSGGVLLQGQGPESYGWPVYRQKVVYVAQQPVLLDDTVEANLKRPFTYQHMERPYPEARARDMLEQLRLQDIDHHQLARSLSVGQQQRLALIRSLLLSPNVLLVDEPTSALDEQAMLAVEELITFEQERLQFATLVVSHHQDQVTRWCHREIDVTNHGAGAAS